MNPTSPGVGSGHAGHCNRPDLASLLPQVDDLSGQQAHDLEHHARTCAQCGPQLELLRTAQSWLESRPLEQLFPRTPGSFGSPSAGECPSAEELYDFGRGPGAQPLAGLELRSISVHVAHCGECSAMLRTLASKPPIPLDLTADEVGSVDGRAIEARRSPRSAMNLMEPMKSAAGARPVLVTHVVLAGNGSAPSLPRPRRQRRWMQLAAAAAVLALGVLWQVNERRSREETVASGSLGPTFPAAPVLRGDAASALLFPRDRLLAVEPDAAHPSGLLFEPRFEVTARDGAREYRVRLLRNSDNAFDPGQPLGELRSTQPVLPYEARVLGALDQQFYTWEAWGLVNGLDTFLGRRDFEVVRDAELTAEIARLLQTSEPQKTTDILALLHERGFLSDARSYALTLPASQARDDYLRALPGR
jgi:hypothetical protein